MRRPRPLSGVYAAFDRILPVVAWLELLGGITLAVLALFGIIPTVQVAAAIASVVLAHQGFDAIADRRA